jgi:hypothetical protein
MFRMKMSIQIMTGWEFFVKCRFSKEESEILDSQQAPE